MAVCREVRRQTLTAGERAIAAAVKEHGVTRYEVRRELRRVKQLALSHLARRRAADRQSVQPLAKDALWAQDATKVGDAAAPAVEAPAVEMPVVEMPAVEMPAVEAPTVAAPTVAAPTVAAPAEDGKEVAAVPTVALLAEVVRDVATTRTVGLSIGPAADAEDVISLLDRIIAERGVAPLVWSTDNGPPYVSQRLVDYLRERQIVHLRNLPRTPQHNAAAERGEGELKAGARFLPTDDPETRARKLHRTADRLNRYRRRATRKGLTAHEADLILPPATSIVSREEFYEACRIAVEEAVKAKTSRRARRLAEREAILAVMERYELVKITGGRRRAAPPASLSN